MVGVNCRSAKKNYSKPYVLLKELFKESVLLKRLFLNKRSIKNIGSIKKTIILLKRQCYSTNKRVKKLFIKNTLNGGHNFSNKIKGGIYVWEQHAWITQVQRVQVANGSLINLGRQQDEQWSLERTWQ